MLRSKLGKEEAKRHKWNGVGEEKDTKMASRSLG